MSESGVILMRYDTKVYFWTESEKYNPLKHSKEKHIQLTHSAYANVTDLGIAKQVELLGGIKNGTKTIRLVDEFTDQWDYITLDAEGKGKKYRFISSLNVLKGYAMIVGTDNAS